MRRRRFCSSNRLVFCGNCFLQLVKSLFSLLLNPPSLLFSVLGAGILSDAVASFFQVDDTSVPRRIWQNSSKTFQQNSMQISLFPSNSSVLRHFRRCSSIHSIALNTPASFSSQHGLKVLTRLGHWIARNMSPFILQEADIDYYLKKKPELQFWHARRSS